MRYNEKTHEALIGSVLKWARIVAGLKVDEFALDCPLCQRFIQGLGARKCARWYNGEIIERCPVAEEAGANYCAKTPHMYTTDHEYLEYANKNDIKFLTWLTELEMKYARKAHKDGN